MSCSSLMEEVLKWMKMAILSSICSRKRKAFGRGKLHWIFVFNIGVLHFQRNLHSGNLVKFVGKGA